MRFVSTILAAALLLGASVEPSFARDEEKKKSFICRPEVYELLTKAQSALKDDKFDSALDYAERIMKRMRPNKHEKALTLQVIGYIYAGQNKLKLSAKTLEECLELDSLPDQTQLSIRYNVGQIYLAAKDYTSAVKAFDGWIARAEKPGGMALYTIAAAKFQAKQYQGAVQYAEWAVRSQKNPKDSWLQLLLSSYFETKNYPPAVGILKTLISRHPEKKSQWLQLSALYSQLGDDKNALAVMELAHKSGLLTKHEEIMSLAQRYMHQRVPAKAGQLLQSAMTKKAVRSDADAMKMLATAWLQARELSKAAPAMERAAAAAKDGEMYARLAQIQLEREKWSDAIRAGQEALKKGSLKNPGQVYLLMGIAQHRLGKDERARALFARASNHASTKRSALGWMKYLSSTGGPAGAQ